MSSAPHPLETVTENVAFLVSEVPNRTEVAKRSGGLISPRNVSYAAEGKHKITLRSLLGLGYGLRMFMWQFFIAGMPRNRKRRRELAFLARAFIELGDENKERLVKDAEILATGEGKLEAIKKAVAREELSLGIVGASREA